VAEDDDSGYRRNAKINQILMPGTYYVRVRHFSKKRTGQYKIGVRRRPL
jgi:tyrosinase